MYFLTNNNKIGKVVEIKRSGRAQLWRLFEEVENYRLGKLLGLARSNEAKHFQTRINCLIKKLRISLNQKQTWFGR